MLAVLLCTVLRKPCVGVLTGFYIWRIECYGLGLWFWGVEYVKLYDDFTHCLLCIECFQRRDIFDPVAGGINRLYPSVLSPTSAITYISLKAARPSQIEL